MDNDNAVNNENQDSELEQRLFNNFAFNENSNNSAISNEKLNEMSKKLPSWSLEPPYNFIK